MCGYKTNRLSSMNKHNISKKHMEKVLYEKEQHKKLFGTRKICEYCDSPFVNTAGLSKHLLHCSKKQDSAEILKKENELLKEQLLCVKEQLLNAKEQIIEIRDDKESFKIIAKNNAEVSKASMNAISYVIAHYKTTPPIKQINNFLLLHEDYEKKYSIS